MDVIRESLIYKNNVLHVCMNSLTRQEQYEFLRLVVATRKEGITFCYDNSNSYIVCILEKIQLKRIKCEKHQDQ
jgi:hypothetical protein